MCTTKASTRTEEHEGGGDEGGNSRRSTEKGRQARYHSELVGGCVTLKSQEVSGVKKTIYQTGRKWIIINYEQKRSWTTKTMRGELQRTEIEDGKNRIWDVSECVRRCHFVADQKIDPDHRQGNKGASEVKTSIRMVLIRELVVRDRQQ